MAGERVLPHQEQSAQVGLPREHSGLQLGGPVIIPKVLDRGKMFFFVSQEFTDDLRPATFYAHQLPDGARAARRLLADLLRQRERPRPGHAAADHQPGHRPAVPGQQDSSELRRHRRLRQRLHAPARPADAESAAHAERHSRPAAKTSTTRSIRRRHILPLSERTTRVRLDVVLNNGVRGSYRFIKDRETTSATTSSRLASAGRTTPCRARSSQAASPRCSARRWSTKTPSGRAQQLRVHGPTTGEYHKTTATGRGGARHRPASPRTLRRVPRSARPRATTSRMNTRTCRR